MRYSQIQDQFAQSTRVETAWKWNAPLLEGVKNKYRVEVPEKVINQVKGLGQRLAKIIVLTYNDFDDKFKASCMPENTCVMIDGRDPKSGFPIAYVYAPEFEMAAQRLLDKETQRINMKRMASLLKKVYDVQASETFIDFVSNVLPANIPFQTYFDGSRERVEKLVEKDGAKMYGNPNDLIFAVEHTLGGVPTITVFESQLDYEKEFAKRLAKCLTIPMELAMRISHALPHDIYYSVHDQLESNFENYVTKMAYLLKVKPGDVVAVCE